MEYRSQTFIKGTEFVYTYRRHERRRGEETNRSQAHLQTQLIPEGPNSLLRLRYSDPGPADDLLQLPNLLPDCLSVESTRVCRFPFPLPIRLHFGHLRLRRQEAERHVPL